MKRVLLSLLILSLPALAQARGQIFDGRVWRSSFIAGNDVVNTNFSTAPIVIGAIVIASPAVNQDGNNYVAFRNSTSSAYIGQGTTVAFVATNSGPAAPLPSGTRVDLNVMPSSNTVIDKRGGASVLILWDWWNLYTTGVSPKNPQ